MSSTKTAKDSPNDLAWTFVGAVLFGVPALVVGWAAAGWASASEWMLEHGLLLPASADPVLVLPRTGGAGLDWNRIVLALAALAALSAVTRVVAGAIIAASARQPRPERHRSR